MKRRQNVLIILFVIAVMAVYTGYEANKPQPIDWSPNFSISKKSPYGTYIIKDALPYLFPEGEGQLFWFYKRQNRTQIPSSKDFNNMITMEKSFYLFDLPQDEKDKRGVE